MAVIDLKRNGKNFGVTTIDEEMLLSDLRAQLRKRSKDEDKNLRYGDRFLSLGGNEIDFQKELDIKVRQVLKDGIISIQGTPEPAGPSPKRDITVKDGKSGSRLFTNQEVSQTLYEFKQYLIKQTEMSESDIFVLDGADVQDEQARDMRLAVPADKNNNTIAVKKTIKQGGVEFGTAPEIKPTAPTLPDWSEKIEWGSPQYPTPTKFAGKAPDPKDPEHKWSTLTEDEKRYVFSRKQLGSAIIFSKTVGSELDRASSSYKAVTINVAEPGVTEQQLNAKSSFQMTYSQMVHELRKRGMTSASASVGAKGVAVKGGFSTSNVEFSQADRTNAYMSQLVYKPAVKLDFKSEHIQATEAFKNAIKAAVEQTNRDDPYPSRTRYYALLDVLKKYGHFIPTEFMLGGAFVIEEVKSVDKAAKIDEQSTSFSAGVGAEVNGVTAAVEAGNTTELKRRTTSLATKQSVTISQIGGDTGAFSSDDPSPWLQSLRYSPNWSVIEYSGLTPTIQYLPPDLLRECLALIKAHWADPETEGMTALNMLEYATLAESARIKSEAPDVLHEIYGGAQL
jgi:MAC/Perforin domain